MLPKGWKLAPLGSVLERVVKPVQVEPSREYREIGIRSHGKGAFHKSPVSGASLGDKRVFWVVPNALVLNIVFAWEQAVAITSERENGMIASHRFPMYRPLNGRCDLRYLLHFFKTSRGKALLELASPGGAGRNKTLGQKEFDYLKVPMPSILEQERIASLLDTWDQAIAAVERLRANSYTQKQAMLQKLISGKQRLSEFSEKWVIKKLGKVSTMSSGGTPPTKELNFYGGSVPWVSIADMTKSGKYIHATERTLTEEGIANSAAKIFPKGTVLYAMYASIGECCIADTELATSQAILGITPNEQLRSEFLYYHLQSYKDRIRFLGQKGTQSNLNAGMVRKMTISLPPLPEQDRIIAMLRNADEVLFSLTNELNLLKCQKYSLQQQLISGKRRIHLTDSATEIAA